VITGGGTREDGGTGIRGSGGGSLEGPFGGNKPFGLNIQNRNVFIGLMTWSPEVSKNSKQDLCEFI
jgi:hypothetical protein